MNKFLKTFSVLFFFQLSCFAEPTDDGKLRIIAFGAHPDDCEGKMAGVAAMWAKLGHHVKLVSMTNGDIGHWKMSGGALAKRRVAEVQEASRRLGTTAQVLDIHDGELRPTLENTKTITRLIREWKADVVLTHRPNDYHPDHRYTGVIIQDAAFMVKVPFYCPDTPHLKVNPLFVYYSDGFQRPNKFRPDIAVSIDDVFDKKVSAIDALVSQKYEGGAGGNEKTFMRNKGDDPVARLEKLTENWSKGHIKLADTHREALIKWYGEEKGKAVKHAEFFEICEYGRRRVSEDELKKLFPFYGK